MGWQRIYTQNECIPPQLLKLYPRMIVYLTQWGRHPQLTPSSHTRGHVTPFMQLQRDDWHGMPMQQSQTIRIVLQSMQMSMEARRSANKSPVVDPHTQMPRYPLLQ